MLAFARKYRRWKYDQWKKVLFSDESRIQRFGSDGKENIWRKINETPSLRRVKPTVKKVGGNIMIWGCMSAKGIGWAARINGTMDIKLYLQILKDEIDKSVDCCFDKNEKDE